MNKKLSVLRRITAIVLCVTLLSSQVVVANDEDSERMDVQTNSEITDISEQDGFSSDTSETSDITESDIPDSFEGESEPNTDISSEVTEKFDNSEDQGFTDEEETIMDDENTSDTLEEVNPDYEDGKICIYNYQQLLQIGTGTQMFSGDKDGNVGEGDKVLADGAELTYASDASYCLMNDIPIDNENVWNFPSDFTGSITSSSEHTDNMVYDSATDTIYVYNRYQLALMQEEDSDSEPVMSEDYIAEKVGMGQVFTLEDGSYLTYSKTHNYVLASSFTTETPELLANKAGTEETIQNITSAYPSDYEGRNYFGQVVKKIGDKNYILIGNETQLRAIGTDVEVTEPIWRVYETRKKNEAVNTDIVQYILKTHGENAVYPSEHFIDAGNGYCCVVATEWLYQAMLLLPPKQKEVVILEFWYGMSISEISETLRISRRSVSERKKNAFANIRSYYERTQKNETGL